MIFGYCPPTSQLVYVTGANPRGKDSSLDERLTSHACIQNKAFCIPVANISALCYPLYTLTWRTHLSMSTSLSRGSLQTTFIGTLNAAEFMGYGHSCQIRGKRGFRKISYSTHGRKSSDNLAEVLD